MGNTHAVIGICREGRMGTRLTDVPLMRIGPFAAAVIAVALVIPTVRPSAQASNGPAREQTLTKQDGLRAMRMMLSAQSSKPFGPKVGYGTLAEILPLVPIKATLIDEQTASFNGYTIRLTRSEDRMRFEISLVPQTGCDVGWFGSDRNVICTGRAIGCPAQ